MSAAIDLGHLILTAALLGFAGSTHCVAMCGGIAGALSASRATSGLRRTGGYHAGRIVSYGLAGAAAGFFGALVQRVAFFEGAELSLRLFAGLALLLLGLSIARVTPLLSLVERLGAPLWKILLPLAKDLLARPTLRSALGIGLLWGWMPCGLVYAALALALATGSAHGGALVMLAFGLGTLPMHLALALLARRWASSLRVAWVRQAAGGVVVAFGLFYIVAASSELLADDANPAREAQCARPLPAGVVASLVSARRGR